jgi:hypothetical protein
MHIQFEADWLGTEPCFYHERTGAVSNRIHDVIDYRALEIDPDGLRDYLDFGYCALGHTPVRHVRLLPPCTRLVKTTDGRLEEQSLPDPIDDWRGRQTSVTEVIERIRTAIQQWEAAQSGDIVLPLSGGYDSRLLAALVATPARLRGFTYGVSRDQEASREVRRARRVAEQLGFRWERVPLGDFHDRIPAWESRFGISTHAHGMYHLEFFEAVARRTSGRSLLSGAVGDPWAGSIPPQPARTPDDLPELGLSRGLNAASVPTRLRTDGRYREAFWQRKRERLQEPTFQVVETFRLKMTLLSYLLTVPRELGFRPWSPFLESDIAGAMLALPAAERRHRAWQRTFFASRGLDVDRTAGGSAENNLDLFALQQHPPKPLDLALLRELFREADLERINRLALSAPRRIRAMSFAQGFPVGQRVARLLRLPNPHQSAYSAYLTLKPLEFLLHRRNHA